MTRRLGSAVVLLLLAGCFDPPSRAGRDGGCFPGCPVTETCVEGLCVNRVTEFLTAPVFDTIQFQPLFNAAGPDGNMWFTQHSINRVGRLTPEGVYTSFELPTHEPDAGGPWDITAGPDGAMWFTEATNRRVGRITTDGTLGEFPPIDGITATGALMAPLAG